MNTPEGTAIELRLDGHTYLDERVVSRHVSDEEAEAAIVALWEDYHDEDEGPSPAHGPWRHRWGAFEEPDENDGWSEEEVVFQVYDEPGDDRFPVTWAEDQERIDYRAWRKRRVAELRDGALADCPYAAVVEVSPGAWDGSGAVVKLSAPGVRSYVLWTPDKRGTVLVGRADVEAWVALRDAWRKEHPDT